MIAKEFPENVATMFAILETFFGIGMIVGPTVGGALYEAGGFTLPFVSLGIVIKEIYSFTESNEFVSDFPRRRLASRRSIHSLHIAQRAGGRQPADGEAVRCQSPEGPLHPHGML